MSKETLYDRLAIPRDATAEEIRRAYREMVLRFHPDRNVNPGETELFIGVQEAFETLIDPKRKAEYDSQLPSWSAQSEPINITTVYSRNSLVKVAEPQLLYVLLNLDVRPGHITQERPLLNLCLVLDCSTSMQGARLDTVKATAIEVIRQLNDKDILSIVKFNDRAEVILPATQKSNLHNAELYIQLLQAGGGTEIYQGLEAGMRELRTQWSANRINHIIMITDGRTYGDENNCLQLASYAHSLHVGISALGIGSKWNDAFLDTLTASTGSSSRFISRAEDIRHFMMEKVFSLGKVFADQVTFHFETAADVNLTYAFRLHPESAPLAVSSPLVMGSVPREGNQAILLEFQVKTIPEGSNLITLARGQISYQVPSDINNTTHIQRLVIERPISNEYENLPPPSAIMHAMSRLTLYRMQEHARADLARGDIQEASRRLQNLATHLLSQGQHDLARSVLSEVAHIQKNMTFSEEGEKRIKYGTRSLLLPPGIEEKKL
jgi:Ca-activated chloride channel family protein